MKPFYYVAKDAVGRNLWGPHRIASLQGVKVTSVFSGSCAVHSVIVIEGGKALTWGRNDKGQLGHCDNKRRDIPTLVETLKDHNIVSAACGRGHTLFLSAGKETAPDGKEENKRELKDFNIRQRLALSILYLNISTEYRSIIENVTDPVEAWKLLRDNFRPDNRSYHLKLFGESSLMKN
ncbi:protein RCC2 homolog [Trichonephila clavipes]|nr:protein RCC2 homolog [Trichonephila clavipes]